MAVGVQQQQRRDTEANWVTSGKILAAGEIGYATDSHIIKLGDGVNTWDNLDIPYDGRYLPIGGKAADSEMLDGISSGGFLLVGDATTAATADKVAKRTSAGRLKAVAGATTDDVVNFDQMVAADVVAQQMLISRTVTAAFTLALTDTAKVILVNNSSATYTTFAANIPTNASVPFVIGSVVTIITTGKGPITLTPAVGVTLTGATAIPGGGSRVTLVKTGTDTWLVASVVYSPGPVLRRNILTGAGLIGAGFYKLSLNGTGSGFYDNVDTLGANEQYNAATDVYKAVCRRSGIYDIKAQVTIADSVSGRAYVKLKINNTDVHLGNGGPKGSVVDTGPHWSGHIPLSVGDYVEVYGFQEVAGSVTVTSTNDSGSEFSWAWLRPL